MNEYKKAMIRAEMPAECEERIRDMLARGSKRERRPAGRKILRLATAAAAAVLLLVGGTMAAGGEWSDLVDLFRARNGDVYTETQIAQITELEENVGLSAESEGITVTVDSVLTGDHSVDVLLRVEGADISLNKDAHYSFYNFRSAMESELAQYFGEDAKTITCESVGVGENEVYVWFHREQYANPSRSLRNGDHTLVLTLEDFYEYGESRGDEKVRYGGCWVFELPLREVSGENRIVLEGRTLSGWQMEYRTNERMEASVCADEMVITSSCVWISYMSSEPGAVHLDVQAVMKDGNVIGVENMSGQGYEGHGTVGYTWEEIIELEELDHLLVGEEIVSVFE